MTTRPTSRPAARAVVVGGGVAGLACALRLAQEGAAVTLLETRRKLGGRATSFTDVRSGETLDNCQHVALACCVNYLDLCRRLGVADLLAWTDTLHWVEEGGRVSTLRPGVFPAPGHFTGGFLRAAFLSATEKAAIARAMLAMLGADDPRFRPGADATFADFLAAHRQPPRAIDRFWTPVVVSACNLLVHRVAASCAIKVFRDGFLATRAGATMAVSRVPLLRLYDAAEHVLRDAGGEIRLGVSVERLDARSVRTDAGETIEADAVVCAVPPERAVRLIDPALHTSDPRFAPLARFTHSPILGVHLAFDREVLELPHAVLVDRPTQWLFNKSIHEPDDGGGGGQRLHAVISAADDWLDLSEDEIARRVLQDIHACFPRARAAELLRVRAVKEKRATFAATPEIERLRPLNTGPSGLLLAGDYTDTGWPATMEGATRSGYLAAAAILGRPDSWALTPDLRPAPLVRAIGAI